MTETETKNISIEHIAKLTKSNDIVEITKADGNVTIDTSINKGSDVLKFGSDYDASKFETKADGQDLKLTYDSNQTITIKNYFSKDGNSTKSSVKEIEINGVTKNILDLYTHTVSAKGTKINGSMFNDIITGTDKADKISTGAGNDVITAGKGNDSINITGAGEKTINIKDFDGNDVISGIAKADKIKLEFDSVDKTVDYSKSGNNLVATREFYKDLQGNATTNATTAGNKKDGNFYSNGDNEIITEADYNAIGTKAQEGYKLAEGTFYKDKDNNIITKTAYDELSADKQKDFSLEQNVYSTEDKKGNLSYITKDAYDKLASDALTNSGYTKLDKDVYSYADGSYSTDAKKDNESVKETTTIKDYFKNDKNAGKLDGVTNVVVNGKGKIVGGFTNDTITGSAKNDKMYGLGGNNTYIFNSDLETSFGNDTVYATGNKDTLSFAQGSKLEYTLKGNDVIVSVKGEENANLGQVTIKDALKSEKNVNISVGENEVKLENAIQQLLKFDQQGAKKGQTMNGTIFNDTFIGSDYNDKINTGAGDDTITAGKGNDTINITGAGEKTITIANGDGNDIITGIAKADKVTLSGPFQSDKLSYSKSGNDLVITREEESATESKSAVTATTTIKDYFKDSKNADKLAGVTVKDIAVTGKGKIVGTFGNDVITGSAKADKIYTGAGDDAITAGKGNDTIIIDGAGKKTINIANHDGNDIITGIGTAGASVDLKINTEDKLSYSKTGTSNDLIITRSYTEQLTDKKGAKLYTDTITGKQTTSDKVTGVEVKDAKFWQKDGSIITDADYNKIGTDAQKGYTEITTKTYKKGDAEAISADAYGKLTDEEKKGYEEIITKTYKKGNAEAISADAYAKLATDAQADYTSVNDKVYSYGSGKNLTYSTDAEKANTALTKDYTETTTVKDFFKEGNTSDLYVNGKKVDESELNGKLTISGQNIMGTKYDDVINGSNKNDVILEQAGNNTFNIGAKGSSEIYSTGESSNDTYNVENLKTSVDIYDDGGKDTLNINVKDLTSENLRYVFDVDKTGAKGDLIITDTNGINSSKFNGVAINDYFTTKVTVPDTSKEEEGATKTVDVDHKIENINLNGSSITDNVATSIANITNDVQNFLNANKYDSASDVWNGKNKNAKAELKEIYNSGNNKYNFSTVEGNTEQTVTDKIGDNDIYNVDAKFDFAKDKLVISDLQGNNDVLNLAQKADDLTILFNIKKTGTDAEALDGNMYVLDKKQNNWSIKMSGIDAVNALDKDNKSTSIEFTQPANEIISAVQGWLKSANDGKGYDSVDDAFKANDANLADLIAKFAPSQPQA